MRTNEVLLRRAIGAIIICLLGLALPMGSANAVDKGLIEGNLSVSYPNKITDKRTYTPVAGYTPNGGTAAVSLGNCRTLTYCDVIQVDVDPGKLTEPYYVEALLTWDAPTATVSAYDLDLGVWSPTWDYCDVDDDKDDDGDGYFGITLLNLDEDEDDGVCSPGEAKKTQTGTGRIYKTLGQQHPEKASFAADAEKGSFWLIVNALASDKGGPSQGEKGRPVPYTIQLKMKIATFPDYDIDIEKFFRRFTPPPARSRNIDFSGYEIEDEDALTPPKMPGATGPLIDYKVPVLAQSAGPDNDNEMNKTMIFGVLLLLMLGAGTFFFFYMRARRRSSTA